MFAALAVVIGFTIAFVVVPWFVLPRPVSARNRLDGLVINFLRWLAVVTVGVQVLAALHVYETSTIIILCLIGTWYSKLRPRGWTPLRAMDRARHRSWSAIGWLDRREYHHWTPWNGALPAAANVGSPRGAARKGPWAWNIPFTRADAQQTYTVPGTGAGGAVVPLRPRRRLSEHLASPGLLPLVLFCLPILTVLAYGSYLHFQYPLGHAALVPGDDYVHMDWAAELGVNKVYPDGIYPMGLAAVLSYVGKMSIGSNIAEVTRFMGPIIGTLMILGIFYVALRLSRSPGAATFAAGTFGIFGSRPEWHEPWSRQIGALPQELCLAISLFALGVVALAVLGRERDHLWTVAAAGVAMGITHPLPSVFFLGLGPLLALSVGLGSRRLRAGLEVGAVCVAGVLAGFLYIPICLAFGIPFQAGVKGLNPFASAASVTNTGAATFHAASTSFTGLTKVAIVLVVIGFVAALVLMARSKTRVRGSMLFGLAAVSAAVLVAYNPTFLGLPSFYADRTTNIAGPEVALAFAAGLGALGIFLPRVNLRTAGITLGIGIVCLFMFGRTFPNQSRPVAAIEYDDEARLAQQVVAANTNLTYTMIGMPEQRQRSIGRSYFVEMWVFARDVNTAEAEDPSYQLPIPTQSIYLFVEKKPFVPVLLPDVGPTEEYYRNPAKRARIETVAYRWAETYRKYHDNMSVFYDDSDLRVYKISQVPDAEAALNSSQFKDYNWHRGALFNSGPTNPLAVHIP